MTVAAGDLAPARAARYSRLGCLPGRDLENMARLRDFRAGRKRAARRARLRRRAELRRRRELLYAARAVAIQERLIAEGKVRPPGKGGGEAERYRRQVAARMRNDAEAIELGRRYERANGVIGRIRARKAVRP